MSSSANKNQSQEDQTVVTVSTTKLKERLNKVYDTIRLQPRHASNSGLFEYLWDLKELALLEGRGSVQV
ncbi:MAG: hypothetical protein HY711_01655, partial [Candidatus Melainabacteria bacterium]|nr:hypothetical protein [Candidatus Melainabacteria bacterium]